MKRNRIKVLITVLILLVVFATMAIGLSACEETDKDPTHYYYYSCTHCHGSGRTQSGAECGWCNGTGQYAVKKAEYDN